MDEKIIKEILKHECFQEKPLYMLKRISGIFL
jgi:hypothetical protein